MEKYFTYNLLQLSGIFSAKSIAPPLGKSILKLALPSHPPKKNKK